MSRVRFEISMSLDGYVTAANPRVGEPMGDGGQVLHAWAFEDSDSDADADADAHADSQDTVGASIAGRRTYETSIADWGVDGPGGALRTPRVIVSHSRPDAVPDNAVYTFVGSPQEAVAHARTVAGQQDVDVFSADVGGQLLRLGLVDEVRVHLVPVLLGAGTRLLDDAGDHVALELVSVVEGSRATHLRYRVL